MHGDIPASVDSETERYRIMRETMLGKREFTIKELFCSQTSLVKDDGVSSKQRRVESLCDAINEISIEKVLGINWNTFNDKLV